MTFVPFSAATRMSGVNLDGRQLRKGAADAIRRWVAEAGGSVPPETSQVVESIARQGGTPLVVAERYQGSVKVLGVIHLKDMVKGGMRERFDRLRAMGIRTVMITGDNPLTAAAIAAEAGVDDFLAEATPEDKLALIRKEQAGGRLVAMTGDGTNDAPALAQADVGVAMNTGTQAANEAGNMVDLDSNPTKLIEIVEIGKQLLMTRGSLTTFSIANDVAKYFAIIPAMFVATYPAARRAQRHAACLPAVGDPEQRDLQRAHHRRAHSAGAPGRQLPAGAGERDPAPQPADLRRRRTAGAVRRHQADRRRPLAHRDGVTMMQRLIRPAIAFTLLLCALTGFVYPGVVTALAQALFPRQANGSMVERNGRPVGSALIGQAFTRPEYFHSRPSAAGAGYDATASAGSNKGPTDRKLADTLIALGVERVVQEDGIERGRIPADMVTASGSGLDPHISPANAEAQAARVARARRMNPEQVRAVVARHTEGRQFGVLGEPRVNVLLLNLALDSLGRAR